MSDKEITIGAYRGVPVGQGGFATVYRVSGPNNGVFALKLADQDADEATRDSLYHEYCIQSELIHPQIAHAHEFGLHDGRPFIVSDWVEGLPLFEQFPKPAVDDFVRMLRGMAGVLLFVHHRGWVHGDLKPENFRWRTAASGSPQDLRPELCLLDFGLARPVGDADRPRGAGTVGYCAPEFLTNLPADGRADWYAVGIILYECVFGVRPYAAEEPAAEIAGHLEGAPDFTPPKLRPAPDWADRVIARLLAKSPDDRGDDETSLLAWLAEYDPTLEPASLLNEQLLWHARSESLRLRAHEDELLRSLSQELGLGLPAIWSIETHGQASDGWLRQAAGLCSLMGYGVKIDRSEESALRLLETSATPRCEPRIHITAYARLRPDRPTIPAPPQRSLSLLPWDRREVCSYLRGVVGDDDVAEAWTDTIEMATCGLPSAVSDLIHHLIATQALSIDADGWGLDDATVDAWRDQHTGSYITAVFGSLTTSETRLCEWLALGEGGGASVVLRRLWHESEDGFDDTLTKLIARGLVTFDRSAIKDSFDLRLRLHGHDVVVRSSMTAEDVTTRSRQLAEAIESAGVVRERTRAEILSHAFARAGVWDRSAEQSLRAATFAIKADDRARAMRYIATAYESASLIEDVRTRKHWMGHARMVEGDLQKAVGQLDAARQIYRELLALCRVTGDQRLMAETLHDLADLYYVTRRYNKGIRAERRALGIWEKLGDRNHLSLSLKSLGNLHRIASDLPRAREFYLQALEIQRELGLDQFAATTLNNIGIIYWLQYDFVQANSFFREALAIQERLNVPVEIARVLNNLGAIGFVQGMLPESEEYFRRAACLNAEAGAQSEELFNRWNLVEVALESGDLRTAVTLGQKVLHACGEIGEQSTAAEVSALLADAYDRVGDDRRARWFYEDCRRALASLKNDDLQLHLDLQQAGRYCRFRNLGSALAILESVCPPGQPPTNRYRYLDSLVLRAQIAVALGDAGALSEVWRLGSVEADAIAAPHKKAQLAAVCVTGDIEEDWRDRLNRDVLAFLIERPRWHWASPFHLWQARQSARAAQLERALHLVTDVVAQLRQDGHGDMLWRALVFQGEIYHMQADYEPAVRSLDEATRMVKAIAETVDDTDERAAYMNCDDVRTLERVRNRITQLVS